MAPVKAAFFIFAAFLAVAHSWPVDRYFIPGYSSALFYVYDAYKFCPGNNTFVEYYKIAKKALSCYLDDVSTNGNNSICYNIKANVARCFQPLVDYFVECLPEKSKDLPPAVQKAAESVTETFCASSGELLMEASINTCIYEYIEHTNVTVKEKCKKETFQPKLDRFVVEKFDGNLLTKSEVCQIGQEIGDCWQDYINTNCESLKARELFSTFYNAAFSPCKKE